MNRRNLIILLDRLQEVVESAPKIPLAGRSLVEEDEVLDLIMKIRNALPEEVRRAEALSSERERIIEDSQRKAERIIAQAEEHASRLLRESEIIKLAQQEADRIVEEAKQKANELENGARTYAQNVLKSLRESLSKSLTVVENGLEHLEGLK